MLTKVVNAVEFGILVKNHKATIKRAIIIPPRLGSDSLGQIKVEFKYVNTEKHAK